jgi:hypothetical protein
MQRVICRNMKHVYHEPGLNGYFMCYRNKEKNMRNELCFSLSVGSFTSGLAMYVSCVVACIIAPRGISTLIHLSQVLINFNAIAVIVVVVVVVVSVG